MRILTSCPPIERYCGLSQVAEVFHLPITSVYYSSFSFILSPNSPPLDYHTFSHILIQALISRDVVSIGMDWSREHGKG